MNISTTSVFIADINNYLNSIITSPVILSLKLTQLKSGGIDSPTPLESFVFGFNDDLGTFFERKNLTDKLDILRCPKDVLSVTQQLLPYIPSRDIRYFSTCEFQIIRIAAELSEGAGKEERAYLLAIARSCLYRSFQNMLIDIVDLDINSVLDNLGLKFLTLTHSHLENKSLKAKGMLQLAEKSSCRLFQSPNKPFEVLISAPLVDLLFSHFSVRSLDTYDSIDNYERVEKAFSHGTLYLEYQKAQVDFVNENFKYIYPIATLLITAYALSGKTGGELLKIRGKEILEILGNSYPKKSRDERMGKLFSMEFLNRIIRFIRNVDVHNGTVIKKTSDKNKEEIYTGLKRLVDIPTIYFKHIRGTNAYDAETLNKQWLDDIEIHFKVDWLFFFKTKDFYVPFGYIHRESFVNLDSLSTKIKQLLSFKLEQHPEGDFKIKTLLELLGFRPEIKELEEDYDQYKARDIFNRFSNAMSEIKSSKDCYKVNYRNPPEWLSNRTRKPKGWWNNWLNCVIVFKKPNCLLEEKVPAPPKSLPSTSRIKSITLAEVDEAFTNTKVSKRAVSQYLCKPLNYCSRLLTKGAPTQSQLREILDAIEVLKKGKK